MIANTTGAGMMGFGIGYERNSSTGSGRAMPWWLKVAEEEKWAEREFGVYLGRATGPSSGELTLG